MSWKNLFKDLLRLPKKILCKIFNIIPCVCDHECECKKNDKK